eukprot:m.17636 g.17636  ORF g.17636 m.17636 type:complete len:423 (-) comp11594_c0_seq1:158-1426(-)
MMDEAPQRLDAAHLELVGTMETLAKTCKALEDSMYSMDHRSVPANETPILKNVQMRLSTITPTIEDLEQKMLRYRAAVDPLRGLTDLAVEIDSRFSELEEKQRALVGAQEKFADKRARMTEEQNSLHLAQQDFEQEVAEMQTDPDTQQQRQVLKQVRSELRDAHASLDTKTRLLEQRGFELNAATSTISQLQENEAQLQEELRRSESNNRRLNSSARETITKLKRELEISHQREDKAQDLLASEHRKQMTLQMTLQKELASRSSRELPPVDERPSSAAPHLNVLKTMQRNQQLINDITKSRFENERLREDNQSLVLHAKDANSQSSLLRNQVSTNISDRQELARRLHRVEKESKLWQSELTKQAARTVHRHKLDREAAADYQWARIDLLERSSDRDRYSHHSGVPSGTRNIQVHKWGSSQNF